MFFVSSFTLCLEGLGNFCHYHENPDEKNGTTFIKFGIMVCLIFVTKLSLLK